MASERKRRYPDFGNISVLPSGNARARYMYNGTKHKAPRTFPSEVEAGNWLDDKYEDIHRFGFRPDNGANETFEHWAERWLALPARGKKGKLRSPKTLRDYRMTLVNHIYPFLGDVVISDIDKARILRFKESLNEKFENGCDNRKCIPGTPCRTRQNAEKYTSYVLAFAVRQKAISDNPYEGDEEIYVPWVKTRRDVVPLEIEDIEKLVATIDAHYAKAIWVAAYLGLRAGELWALRKSSVDLVGRELKVTHSVGDKRVLGPTKNHETRTLSIPEGPVLEALRYQVESIEGGPEGWLFLNKHGRGITHDSFMGSFYEPAVVAAGLPAETVFHDLRHFCARFHISQGFEAFDIMRLLGHKSVDVTMDVYGSYFKSRREAMAQKVSELMVARKAELAGQNPANLTTLTAPELVNQ